MDTALTQAPPGVLGNDSDPDGDTLTAVLVNAPSHAKSFTLNVNGSFSYTLDANYNGPDSFTYEASDGSLQSEEATVSINVASVNDAPTVAVAGGACGTNDRSGTINLTVNDPDGQAGSLKLSATSNNTTLVPKANVTFGGSGASRTLTATTASGKTGTAVITVTVSDGEDAATLGITLKADGTGSKTTNGTADADMIFGQNGDDTLDGSDKNDLLCGGLGNDTLSGWVTIPSTEAQATTGSRAAREPIASVAARAPTRRPTSTRPKETPRTAPYPEAPRRRHGQRRAGVILPALLCPHSPERPGGRASGRCPIERTGLTKLRLPRSSLL
jgi:VCBS repeat-containing protein